MYFLLSSFLILSVFHQTDNLNLNIYWHSGRWRSPLLVIVAHWTHWMNSLERSVSIQKNIRYSHQVTIPCVFISFYTSSWVKNNHEMIFWFFFLSFGLRNKNSWQIRQKTSKNKKREEQENYEKKRNIKEDLVYSLFQSTEHHFFFKSFCP